MKKIGIITFWHTKDNYGQILQSFALQQYLRENGYSPFLIKYQPVDNNTIWDKFYRKIIFNLSPKRLFYLFSKERKIINEEYNKNLEIIMQANKNAERCKFDVFMSKNITTNNDIYHSIKELRHNPPIADAYICGSDQIWNFDLNEDNVAGWYLNFGDVRKIAYAASIGRKLNLDEYDRFINYLKDFYSISVREDSALDICKRVGFTNAIRTVDPTLLLNAENYKLLFENYYDIKWEQRIFVYALNVSNKNDLRWDEITKFSNKIKLNTEICCSSGYYYARELIEGKTNLHLTVGEWLKAICCSNCVITTSFHGVVFCLIFHTSFVVIPLTGEKSMANDRIFTLLKVVGLRERILTNDNSIEEIMNIKIDWTEVDKKICENRVKSIDFLRNSLIGI